MPLGGLSCLLWRHIDASLGGGCRAKAIFRISRGRPNALDLLRRGEVKWVVCTAGNGNEATEASVRLRSGAVAAGVPLTTVVDGFRAAVRAPAEEDSIGGTGVRTLQEYHFSSAMRS